MSDFEWESGGRGGAVRFEEGGGGNGRRDEAAANVISRVLFGDCRQIVMSFVVSRDCCCQLTPKYSSYILFKV